MQLPPEQCLPNDPASWAVSYDSLAFGNVRLRSVLMLVCL